MSGGDGAQGDVFNFLEKANSPLSRRLTSKEFNSALLTAQFQAMDSSQLIPILNALEKRLDKLRAENPGVTFDVTGLDATVGALLQHRDDRQAQPEPGNGNRGDHCADRCCPAIPADTASCRLHPTCSPLPPEGTFLYLNRHGLQFTSVVAFTVAFGIAVDSTIHVLNRYRLEREKTTDIDEAVR